MARKKEDKKPLIVPPEIVTAEEFQKRVAFYKEYYVKCKETKACRRYEKMKALIKEFQASHWKPGDPPTETLKQIRKLRRICRNTILDGTTEIPKPDFEDPELQQMKNEIGIKDYWEKQIALAAQEGREIIYLNDRVQDTLEIQTIPPTF